MEKSDGGGIKTVADFNAFVARLQEAKGWQSPVLWGIGRAVHTGDGKIATVRYPVVNGMNENRGSATVLMHALNVPMHGVQHVQLTAKRVLEALKYFAPFEGDGKNHANIKALRGAQNLLKDFLTFEVKTKDFPVITFIFDDHTPLDVGSATLKLYALSLGTFKVGDINLQGLSQVLPRVVWYGDIPHSREDVARGIYFSAFRHGVSFSPSYVGSRPCYIDRIDPLAISVIAGRGVPLGTFLGRGTEVYGTILEGIDNTPLSIGRNCRLEIGSVVGVSLGDAVVVVEGCALKNSTMVLMRGPDGGAILNLVSVKELGKIEGVTFWFDKGTNHVNMSSFPRNRSLLEEIEKE